jgi:transcriptional regulator GlxA family with amidase domain
MPGTSQFVSPSPATSRRIVLVAFPGVQPVDVVGPTEVFAEAGALAGGAYSVQVVAVDPSPISTRAGYAIVPGSTIAECRGSIDTLIVAGGVGVPDAERDEALIEWMAAAAARSRRVASVCTGAFLLAAAGLLDGRPATSHWMSCAELARRYPEVMVEHRGARRAGLDESPQLLPRVSPRDRLHPRGIRRGAPRRERAAAAGAGVRADR